MLNMNLLWYQQALRRNPYAPDVPCHRVVTTALTLGGFDGSWVRPQLDAETPHACHAGTRYQRDNSLIFTLHKTCKASVVLLVAQQPASDGGQPLGAVCKHVRMQGEQPGSMRGFAGMRLLK